MPLPELPFGIQVRETKVLSPTLQDAYLHYTGTRLDEEEEKPAPAGKVPPGRKHPEPAGRGGA